MQNSELYILKQLQEGDEQAYISLFKDYYTNLCAYSRRYVGRKDIAEEVVSDTFFKLWQNRQKLEINTSIKAYLFQAVANNSLYYLRQLKATDKVTEYFSKENSSQIGFYETSEAMTEKSLLMEELTTRIEEAIEQLPPQQQKAFKLKRIDGKKNKEIAEEMGLAIKTVEMHLSKAMLSLRENLKDYLPAFLLYMFLR